MLSITKLIGLLRENLLHPRWDRRAPGRLAPPAWHLTGQFSIAHTKVIDNMLPEVIVKLQTNIVAHPLWVSRWALPASRWPPAGRYEVTSGSPIRLGIR